MITKSTVRVADDRRVTISGDSADVDRITALVQEVGPDVDIDQLKWLISEYTAPPAQFVTSDGCGVTLTPCEGADLRQEES